MPDSTSIPSIRQPGGTAAPNGAGSIDTLHAQHLRLPWPRWPRPRWIGSRVLAIGLAACVASGSVVSPSAAAQQPAPAANVVSAQLPTPTPTPTPGPASSIEISTTNLGTGTITLNPTPAPEVQAPITVSGWPTPTPTSRPAPSIEISPTNLGTGTITLNPTPNPTQLPMQFRGDPTPLPQQRGGLTVAGCGHEDYIFQGCPEGATGSLRHFEAQAFASVLQQYQLPESERARVLRYARNEVRAALYAHLLEAFRKEPAARGADERALVEAFTRLVREQRVQAAQDAQNEYQRWAANPCMYEPPPGFTYSAGSACVGMSRLFTPASPGLQAFIAYGVAAVYKTVQDDPYAARVLNGTSNAALLLYGYAAALGAGGAAAAIGAALPISAFSAVLPFAATITQGAATAAFAGGESVSAMASAAAPAGASGAAALAGPVLVFFAAVTTAIVAGYSVFTEAAIPGQLQDALNAARSYDIGAAIRSADSSVSTAAQRELFAAFIAATLPDYPGTDPAPAAQAGDPRLVVEGSPVDWLQYTAADGSQRAVRLSGRWFADRAASAGAGDARLTLSITYRDASNNAWTASRAGNEFLIVRVGDPAAADYPAPRQSPELAVVDANGRAVTARVGG